MLLNRSPNNVNPMPNAGSTPMFFHLKMVAKIALSVGALSCAGLLAVLMLLADETSGTYGQLIGERSLAFRNLGPALLVCGLALTALACVVTWLVALYSSFRIAGPLYRFARNLEMEIEQGPVDPVAIRRGDQLQREWQEVKASAASLRRHFDELREAVAQTERSLHAGVASDQAALGQAVARLKEIEGRVKF